MPKPLSNPQYSPSNRVEEPIPEQVNNAPSEKVWDQFSELFDLIDELAKHPTSPEEFYRRLLAETVAGFAAIAGRAWLAQQEGGYRLLAQIGERPSPDHRAAHEKMLAESSGSTQAKTKVVGLNAVSVVQVTTNEQTTFGRTEPPILIELVQRGDCPEELYRSTEQLLEAISQLASGYHQNKRTVSLSESHDFHRSLLGLAQQVAGDLRLGPTSYRIVNLCRQLLQADRVSLVQTPTHGVFGNRGKLLAVSGTDKVDGRSATTRSLTKFAKMIVSDRCSMQWSTDAVVPSVSAFPEECLDQLDSYADKTHVKSVVAIPIFAPKQVSDIASDESLPRASSDIEQGPIEAVLIVESFQTKPNQATADQMQMAAQVCAPSLNAAIKTPLASLQRSLSRWLLPTRFLSFLVIAATIICLGYAATIIQVEHTVTVRGLVAPIKQNEVYAPADARVARAFVVGGQQVDQGEPLLELRDTRSLLELQQLEGELLAAERELDAISATRISLDRRTVSPSESLRLAAEQERLALRVKSLQSEIRLVESERERLMVRSPLTGIVTTWQPDDLLVNRPVQRGQRLLTIIDPKAGWNIELELPDDRIGILKEAESDCQKPLKVAYELASEPNITRWGTIANYAPVAQDASNSNATSDRVIRLEMAPDDSLLAETSEGKPLAGISVRAEVQCGKQSLAYVAMHDVWHYLLTRWQLGW